MNIFDFYLCLYKPYACCSGSSDDFYVAGTGFTIGQIHRWKESEPKNYPYYTGNKYCIDCGVDSIIPKE